jgi:1-acyl-sn-glycerol-3-phosphate acyltransferase
VSTPAAAKPEGPGFARDPDFIARALPVMERLCAYFRPEVRGFDENVPEEGPFLAVGNHSGGPFTPDMYILMTAWFRRRLHQPAYGLMHSAALSIPVVGSTLARLGAVEAGHGNAEQALRRGAAVLVYPGGDWEVFRPYWHRNRIDFRQRHGFVRLALRMQVPVVPIVSIGSHESVFVLTRGEGIARALGMHRIRTKVFPIVVGLPWGVAPGWIPPIPLPAKVTLEVSPPLDWPSRYGPEAADDDAVVEACFKEVTGTMQGVLDGLAAERRFPVLG